MLEHFRDWKRTELTLYYSDSVYNPTTGQYSRGYVKRGDIQAFVYQSSSMQGLVADKIIDQSDYVGVYEDEVVRTDIAKMGDEYFEVVGPDNVMFQDSVWTFGLKRTEKPDIVEVTP